MLRNDFFFTKIVFRLRMSKLWGQEENARKEMNRSHSIYDSPWAREFGWQFPLLLQTIQKDTFADADDSEAIIAQTIKCDKMLSMNIRIQFSL